MRARRLTPATRSERRRSTWPRNQTLTLTLTLTLTPTLTLTLTLTQALHLASSIGYGEVVRMLIDHGADPSLRTSSGVTASDLAAALGHESLVAYLSSLSSHSPQMGQSPHSPHSSHSSPVASAAEVELVELGSAAPAGSPAPPDARDTVRDAAYALLDAPLAQLSGDELDEIESILQMTLEHIAELRLAAAAAGLAAAAPTAAAPTAAAAAAPVALAVAAAAAAADVTSSTKNAAALARAKANGSRGSSTNASPLGIRAKVLALH